MKLPVSKAAHVTKKFSDKYQKHVNIHVVSPALTNINFNMVFISNLEIFLLETH